MRYKDERAEVFIPLDGKPCKGMAQAWAMPYKEVGGADTYRLWHWKQYKQIGLPFAGPKSKLPC